jgi:hypothetical protein
MRLIPDGIRESPSFSTGVTYDISGGRAID